VIGLDVDSSALSELAVSASKFTWSPSPGACTLSDDFCDLSTG
jgi:hypothetical protein